MTAISGDIPESAGQSPSMVRMQASAPSITMARKRISQAVKADPLDSPGRVVVVYFTPRDRPPAANHTSRIRRIVEETAGFYESELKRHGFANRSMHVLRNQRGQVDIIEVVGEETNYDKPDGRRIREEVIPVLRQRGIDADASVLLLFCNLMDYDPVAGKISHHSPYYGGGNHLSGTAWQCDSEILDPRRFRDPTPIRDGEYGRITIGRHNSIFIGGVIHELGHALSLPHCRQRPDEADRGTALMGSGNRTYAQQLRGEGKGTFLTQTHALRLAAHPVFNRQVPRSIHDRPSTDFNNLLVSAGPRRSIQVSGQISSTIPAHAVVAYFDPDGGGDYDATTASSVPDPQGKFALHSGPLRPKTSGELRLVSCHINGTTSTRSLRYSVNADGSPDLSIARLELELKPVMDELQTGNFENAKTRLGEIANSDPDLMKIGQRVLDRFQNLEPPISIDANQIPSDTKSAWLSTIRPQSAEVGWLRPTYNSVPDKQRLLSLGGDYFAHGIYAHAPAKHVYELQKDWKHFSGRCGIQGNQFGRVDFEVLGDGKSLWKSTQVTAGVGKAFDIDVSEVQILTLKVSDGGNGGGGDWGVWIEPRLTR
ncbi:NPCBM/NEW2 domain-containing protein [Rhodopirellula sp. P2]|uniref:NPCBM/NEW2 domain-containing protein n=1 Tax=Rhodopirellula sp. P2 TaxID=2127060 RepID=UPI002368D2D0|nr:NPCBM/NEW2 domain-containing protein [Rhodopirellula sp. P2]WDQ17198.1 NPCBM/NEW2 domain-containing protein [Rhodopirellula sp. P2]